MKKVFFIGVLCLMALSMQAQSYVDLGLPSKTKWKSQNEKGFYTIKEAVSQFGDCLPTKAQWDELKVRCRWSWTGSGYKITGPNGNSIILPAEGTRGCQGDVYFVGTWGDYWSSTPFESGFMWIISFDPENVDIGFNELSRCAGNSVRLVQK